MTCIDCDPRSGRAPSSPRADRGRLANLTVAGAAVTGSLLIEVRPGGVEYLVRAARITDIDRIVALVGDRSLGRDRGPLSAADLLRQLVYLPQASVLVAELRREVVGAGVLVLRPSVRAGGYIGTIDLLVVGPDHDVGRVTESLVEELIRSATNKGCTIVEVAQPGDPTSRATWERLGFAPAGPVIARVVGAVGGVARRSSE
jgi:predicted N-acetyltransferase YhbS